MNFGAGPAEEPMELLLLARVMVVWTAHLTRAARFSQISRPVPVAAVSVVSVGEPPAPSDRISALSLASLEL